mmetsp:Transcript_6118/g.16611  ORF Transcript_6118/g.16611 Transcript_6118/m.16611 type:complete len:246 (+) Transcript_6118:332-1069(+)
MSLELVLKVCPLQRATACPVGPDACLVECEQRVWPARCGGWGGGAGHSSAWPREGHAAHGASHSLGHARPGVHGPGRRLRGRGGQRESATRARWLLVWLVVWRLLQGEGAGTRVPHEYVKLVALAIASQARDVRLRLVRCVGVGSKALHLLHLLHLVVCLRPRPLELQVGVPSPGSGSCLELPWPLARAACARDATWHRSGGEQCPEALHLRLPLGQRGLQLVHIDATLVTRTLSPPAPSQVFAV